MVELLKLNFSEAMAFGPHGTGGCTRAMHGRYVC